MKKCSKCGSPKEENEFRKGRNQCKECYNEVQKNWALNNPEKIKVKAAKTYKKRIRLDTKVCNACGKEKNKTEYHLSSKTCNKCKEKPKVIIPKITDKVISMVQPKQKMFVAKDPKEIIISKKHDSKGNSGIVVNGKVNLRNSVRTQTKEHSTKRMPDVHEKVRLWKLKMNIV